MTIFFASNYRPISLLPTLSKKAESVIKTRLDRELDGLDLIQSEQFGFRKNLSTELQLVRVVKHILEGRAVGRSTEAVFLDLASAFDKVWHDGLLWKMRRAGFSPSMVGMVASYLRGRTFEVKVDGCTSGEWTIGAGVPQGSVLGPTLFNIYLSDIPRSEGVQMALFAQYLGVTLEAGLTWRSHIDDIKKKMAVRMKILKPKWIRGSGMSLKNKATLCSQVVRPVAMYACPAWSTAARTRRSEVSTLENKILRGILGAPWFVRDEQIRGELGMVPISGEKNKKYC